MKVRDVEAFHISGEGNVFLRADYKNNVELPGLEACLYLYDMNIQTTWFNCNKECPNVELHFSYDTLSEENKKIAEELASDRAITIDYERGLCYVDFGASLNDDVDVVKKTLLIIVKQFVYQDVLYGYELLDDDFIERYFRRFYFDKYYDLDDKDVLKSLIGEEYLGYYYDEESNRVWYNEELFQKHQAYLNSDKGKGTI